MNRRYLTLLIVSALALIAPAAWNVYDSVVFHDWQASPRFDGQAYLLSSLTPLPAQTTVDADGTGAAAMLATLATWTGDAVTQEEAAARLLADGYGTTLADFAEAAAGYGLTGHWLRTEPAALYQIKQPFVAHTADGGGRLVIVRDARNGYVYVTDPQRGQFLYSMEGFTAGWTGQVFAFPDPPAQPEAWW